MRIRETNIIGDPKLTHFLYEFDDEFKKEIGRRLYY